MAMEDAYSSLTPLVRDLFFGLARSYLKFFLSRWLVCISYHEP